MFPKKRPTPYPKKTFLALVEEKLPLLAIAAASAAMTMKAQKAAGAVVPMGMYPLSVRLSNAIVSYARYLAKTFWPAHLALIYPHPENSLKAWQVFGALAVLLAITLLVLEKRRHRYLLVGWLWFLGTLVPMIGLVQVGRQAMADRYAYLPLLGTLMMVCWAVGDWAAKALSGTAVTAVSCAVLFALVVAAHRQIGYWADNVTLGRTVEVTRPNSGASGLGERSRRPARGGQRTFSASVSGPSHRSRQQPERRPIRAATRRSDRSH